MTLLENKKWHLSKKRKNGMQSNLVQFYATIDNWLWKILAKIISSYITYIFKENRRLIKQHKTFFKKKKKTAQNVYHTPCKLMSTSYPRIEFLSSA